LYKYLPMPRGKTARQSYLTCSERLSFNLLNKLTVRLPKYKGKIKEFKN